MADWIKVDHVTPSKPEIVRIAASCKKSREWALGCMVKMWIWFDAHTSDGVSRGLVLDHLASAIGIPRQALVAALQVGWLVQEGDDHFAVPQFRKYMSDTKKEREKKRRQRDNAGTETGQKRDTTGDKNGTIEREGEKRTIRHRLSPMSGESASPPQQSCDDTIDIESIFCDPPEDDTSEYVDASRTGPSRRAGPPRDPERAALWAAIRDVTGLDTSRPRSCKRIQQCIRELRAADPPYTADEVRRLPDVFRELGWDITISPETIAKHIDLVRRQPVRVNGSRRDSMDALYEELDRDLQQWVERKKREARDGAR